MNEAERHDNGAAEHGRKTPRMRFIYGNHEPSPEDVYIDLTHELGTNEPIEIGPFPREVALEASIIAQFLKEQGMSSFLFFASHVWWQIQERAEDLPELDKKRAHALFWRKMVTQPIVPDDDTKNTYEDRVILLTYLLLRKNQISWDEAAVKASQLLGREIKREAWRKRVTRWAEAQGYPKIEKYKRTKRTKTDKK